MSFETFPGYHINVPEIFHPAPVERPPIFNTSETIAPLLHLAQYLSPEARALRKAAVAKANWEYRAYTSGNPRAALDPLFYWHLRGARANIAHIEALTKKALEGKGGADPRVAPRLKRDFPQINLNKTPGTYQGDVNTSSVVTPTSNVMNNDDFSTGGYVEPGDLTQNEEQ